MGLFSFLKPEKQEPISSVKQFDLAELEAQLSVLPKDANVVYLLWFERQINPVHMQMMHRMMDGKGLQVLIITGLMQPDIYKLQKAFSDTSANPDEKVE